MVPYDIIVYSFKFLQECTISGFILGGVYGARRPVCPFDEKFPPRCLLILIERPDTWKCAPQRKN